MFKEAFPGMKVKYIEKPNPDFQEQQSLRMQNWTVVYRGGGGGGERAFRKSRPPDS